MRRLLWLLAFCGGLLPGQDISSVRSVYLLPMAGALDQYLANRLTQERIFQVVTDPKLADAVFSDRIGESFEEKWADVAPNPEPVSPGAAGQPQPPSVNKLGSPAENSSWGRAKGTVFLVDPKSHRVLWSAYQPLKGSSSRDMNRTASDIVSRLKGDLKPK